MTKRWLSVLLVLTLVLTSFVSVSAGTATEKPTDFTASLVTFEPVDSVKFRLPEGADPRNHTVPIGTFSVDGSSSLTDSMRTSLNFYLSQAGLRVKPEYGSGYIEVKQYSIESNGALYVDFDVLATWSGMDLPTCMNRAENPGGWTGAVAFTLQFTDVTKVNQVGGVETTGYLFDFSNLVAEGNARNITKLTYASGISEAWVDFWAGKTATDVKWGTPTTEKLATNKASGRIPDITGSGAIGGIRLSVLDSDAIDHSDLTNYNVKWTVSDPTAVQLAQRNTAKYGPGHVLLTALKPAANVTITATVTNAYGEDQKTVQFMVTILEQKVDTLTVTPVNYRKYESGVWSSATSGAGFNNTPLTSASTAIPVVISELPVGSSMRVKADVLPANASDKTITWSSENPAYVSVEAFDICDADGNVLVPNGEVFVRGLKVTNPNAPVVITAKSGDKVVKFSVGTIAVPEILTGNANKPFARPTGYSDADAAVAASFTHALNVKLSSYTSEPEIYYRVNKYASKADYEAKKATLPAFNNYTAKSLGQLFTGDIPLSSSGLWVIQAVTYYKGQPNTFGSVDTLNVFYNIDIQATGVTLAADKTNLVGVDKATVTATVTPEGVDLTKGGWSVSPANGVSIAGGVVTTTGAYVGTVTVTYAIDGQTASLKLNLAAQEITNITPTATQLTIPVGEWTALAVTTAPANAPIDRVSFWQVSDYGVKYAEKDESQLAPIWISRMTDANLNPLNAISIFGNRLGTTKIYMRTPNGKVATVDVTVTSGSKKVNTPIVVGGTANGGTMHYGTDGVTVATSTYYADLNYEIYNAVGEKVASGKEIANMMTIPHSVLAENQKNTILFWGTPYTSDTGSGYDRYSSSILQYDVTSEWYPTSITVAPTDVTLNGGETKNVQITVLPANVLPENRNVTVSYDGTMLDVKDLGNLLMSLTGKKEGTTKLTVKAEKGTASASVNVNILPMDRQLKGVRINTSLTPVATPPVDPEFAAQRWFNGTAGWAEQLGAWFYDADNNCQATPQGNRVYPINTEVTWESNDKSVATVDANGLVSFVGTGFVQITVKKQVKADNGTTTIYKDSIGFAVAVDNTKGIQPADVLVNGAAPVANAVYTEEATVTLSSPVPGAQIYYVLDEIGGPKTQVTDQNGTLYTGPIKLHENKTVVFVVYAPDRYHTASSYLDMKFDIAVKTVTFPDTIITMYVGDTHQLTPAITPSYANVKSIVWSTNNKEIADVDQNGLVTAISCPGDVHGMPKDRAIITVTVNGQSGKVYVIVKEKPESIAISTKNVTITAGDIRTLSAAVRPTSLTTKDVEWFSSDNSILSINLNSGEITGIKAGTVTVTAKIGSLTDTCQVTVLPIGKAPDAPQKRVTFEVLEKNFSAIKNGTVRQIIGQIVPGDGESWDQISYYYNPMFAMVDNDLDAAFEVDDQGFVSMFIKDAGTNDQFFSYKWQLIYKPGLDADDWDIPGATNPGYPGDIPNASGETIKGNKLTIVNAPTAIVFTPSTVADIEMYTTDTKVVTLGKIDNYADFVATEVAVNAVSTGLSAAKASIASDGTVSVTISMPNPVGVYPIATVISANGCAAVNAPSFNANVLEAPIPPVTDPAIVIKSATKPYENVQKNYTVYTLALADGVVDFDVVGTTANVTKWVSSKPKILKINSVTGEATLKKVGTGIKVTAYLSDGTKLQMRVAVQKIADSIKLCYMKSGKCTAWPTEGITIGIGTGKKVRCTPKVIAPAGGKLYGITWTFSDPTVATRSGDYIIGLKEGMTDVTVTLYNGVTVTRPLYVSATKVVSDRTEKISSVKDIVEIPD